MKKQRNTNNLIIVIVACVVAPIVLLAAVAGIYMISIREHSTTDVADYGKYVGNYDNHTVRDFVNGFFPKQIESYFQDVHYSYRARKPDAYAYEVYLELSIEDMDRYDEFVAQYTKGLSSHLFAYDSSYTEFVISDEFEFHEPIITEEETYCHIEYAEIGKILCCDSQQKVIFVALGVYDGGGVSTQFLNVYFNRFGIKPWEEYKEC